MIKKTWKMANSWSGKNWDLYFGLCLFEWQGPSAVEPGLLNVLEGKNDKNQQII